jgi:hypothetical protein
MIKSVLKKVFGERRYLGIREGYHRYHSVQELFADGNVDEIALLKDNRWTQSQLRIRRYRDMHRGKRCFIIGNGPSLQRTDLSKLTNEVTFGMNRIYLMAESRGFMPTYYVAVNQHVIQQCAQDIQTLRLPRFLAWHSRDALRFEDGMMFIRDPGDLTVGFSRDIAQCVWEGTTVTFAALQIAYYMGFDDVILVGVDHSFTTQGSPHKLIESTGDDADHFDVRYFGRGFKWQLPDLYTSEGAYRIAKFTYEWTGRKILDATVGGKLTVFPKVDFDGLFTAGAGNP